MQGKSTAVRLAEKGLRATVQRIAVCEYLDTHPEHPTAEAIYTALKKDYPAFSLTTVYNTLHALTRAGMCRVVLIEAEEQRFDGTAGDHAHARCTACGRIWDLPMEAKCTVAEQALPDGFSVTQRDIYLNGLCPDCQTKDNAQGSL